MAENYIMREYSRGRKKSKLARSPRFIFARQNNNALLVSLSFLLFHNFKSSVSTDDDDCVYCEFFCEFFFLHFFNEQE